jgi:peptide/nickel transport system permease protein
MTDVSQTVREKPAKKYSALADFFRRLVKEKPLGTFGAIMVLFLLICAIFANVIAPYNPVTSNLPDRLQGPSLTHLFGTDNLGRDMLSRIIYGGRVSLYVGLGASLVNVLVATLLGLTSGYLGGWFDVIVQRFVDIAISIPPLVILITLVGVLGPGLVQLILIMGINGGIQWARVVRSGVMSIRENVYMDAGRSIGASMPHMIARHVFPNILPMMVIIFSTSIAGNIMAEAGLSFLGLGIPPPTPTWGGMLSAEGRRFMYEAWWLAIFPGLILTIVIYGVNMWGDAVRDLLDPRLRGGVGRYSGAIKREKAKLQEKKEQSLG